MGSGKIYFPAFTRNIDWIAQLVWCLVQRNNRTIIYHIWDFISRRDIFPCAFPRLRIQNASCFFRDFRGVQLWKAYFSDPRERCSCWHQWDNDAPIAPCSNLIPVTEFLPFLSLMNVETRKQIFDNLRKLESLSKPIKHQEHVAIRRMEELKFAEDFNPENVTDTLCAVFECVIRRHESEWKSLLGDTGFSAKSGVPAASEEILRNSKEMTWQNDGGTNTLRGLLQMSDGMSVQSFLALENFIEVSLLEQNAQINKHLYLHWNVDLEQVIRSLLNDVVGLISNAKIATGDYRFINFEGAEMKSLQYAIEWNEITPKSADVSMNDLYNFSEIYNITYEENSTSFSMICKLKNQKIYRNATYCFSNCSIRTILHYKFFIAFFTLDRRIRIYCLRTKYFIHDVNIGELEPLEFRRLEPWAE